MRDAIPLSVPRVIFDDRRYLDMVAVWIIYDRPSTRTWGILEPSDVTDDGIVWRERIVDEGSLLGNPTLLLPRGVMHAIASASSDYAPADAAMKRHLDDAVKIRDRLLAIVEGVVHRA